MKKLFVLVLCALIGFGAAGCLPEEVKPSVTGKVTQIEKFGHAVLDITIADFAKSGFALGDLIYVSAGEYAGDMPYFSGYYVDRGDFMVRGAPNSTYIALCINYGKFAEFAKVEVGDEVSLTLKKKGAELIVEEMNYLEYTDVRADYDSDEIFANFRPIVMGEIAEGRLYRSASPADNIHNRASYANRLAEEAGIRTVMNLADTEEELLEHFSEEDFSSEYYKSLYEEGNVIPLGLLDDISSDEYADGIVRGLTFLSKRPGPYLVHCMEGKDRAGFGSMIIEALMGASLEEITRDYMISYANYYDVEEGSDLYRRIAEKNIEDMLRIIAGLEKDASLEGIDWQEAAAAYLSSHGMVPEAIEALQENLR